jgi:hypothetical protein
MARGPFLNGPSFRLSLREGPRPFLPSFSFMSVRMGICFGLK